MLFVGISSIILIHTERADCRRNAQRGGADTFTHSRERKKRTEIQFIANEG